MPPSNPYQVSLSTTTHEESSPKPQLVRGLSRNWLETNVGSNWGTVQRIEPGSPRRIMSAELGSSSPGAAGSIPCSSGMPPHAPLSMLRRLYSNTLHKEDKEFAQSHRSGGRLSCMSQLSSCTDMEDAEDDYDESSLSVVRLSLDTRRSMLGMPRTAAGYQLKLPSAGGAERPSSSSFEGLGSMRGLGLGMDGETPGMESSRPGVDNKSSTIVRAATFQGAARIHPLIVRSGLHQQLRIDWRAWLAPGGSEKALLREPRLSVRLATVGDLPELLKLGVPSSFGEPSSPEATLRH